MESGELNWCECARKQARENSARFDNAGTIVLMSEKVNSFIDELVYGAFIVALIQLVFPFTHRLARLKPRAS
jgi:hypothetical protein